jgi:O-antigen/teichoic acid export membrane protein
MDQGMKLRILRGFGANGIGQALNILISLAQSPLLFACWGAGKTGEWVALSGIPTMLLVSEMGFGNAAGNEMTMLAAQGRHERAGQVFRATWVALTLASAAVCLAAGAAAWLLPLADWMQSSEIVGDEFRWVVLLLLVQVLASQQALLTSGVYRAAERYARGVMLANLRRLLAFLGLAAGVLLGWGPLGAAALSTGLFVAAALFQAREGLRMAPWARYGMPQDLRGTLSPLVRPALSFAALPMGIAVGMQGLNIAITVLLGPAALATFDVMRRLSRVLVQATSALKEPVQVELSRVLARQELAVARSVHRRLTAVCLWGSLGLAAVMLAAGPFAIRLLSAGQAQVDWPVFALLTLSGVAFSLWSATSSVPMAVNQNQGVTFAFLAVQAGSLAAAALLSPMLGAVGAAASVAAAEAVMCAAALPISLRILQESPRAFLQGLIQAPFRRRAVQA